MRHLEGNICNTDVFLKTVKLQGNYAKLFTAICQIVRSFGAMKPGPTSAMPAKCDIHETLFNKLKASAGRCKKERFVAFKIGDSENLGEICSIAFCL